MSGSHPRRSTADKLEYFRRCFSGLKEVYGTYDPATGRAWQVKQPVTADTMLRHLQGKQPYGVYLLVKDRTRAIAVDFDEKDPAPALAFIRRARSFGLDSYLERSKSKGYHVWLFASSSGVVAAKARQVVKGILADIGSSSTEVFPKQDRLGERARWGNYIYAPLFGKCVPEGRTVFVDPDGDLQPFSDQWDLLERVTRVPESVFDRIIGQQSLAVSGTAELAPDQPSAPAGARLSFGLPPCAQRMLTEGVTQHQRVACFRLASHLRKAGIPEDVALPALMVWATKNRPADGKRIITRAEVYKQTKCAYAKRYRGCGCEDPAIMPYCDSSCPLRRAPASQV